MAYAVVNAGAAARRYVGVSTDTKPVTGGSTTVVRGSELLEADTGRWFVYDGTHWVPMDTELGNPVATVALRQLELLQEQTELLAQVRDLLMRMV